MGNVETQAVRSTNPMNPTNSMNPTAIAGIDAVIKKPTETMRVNMLGTANVLEAAKDLSELERRVDFSTSEVFGQSAFRAEENHTAYIGAVGEARWTYAVSKLAGEHLAKARSEAEEIRYVSPEFRNTRERLDTTIRK